MNLLDPTFLGTTIGILATLIIALVIYLLQRNRKELLLEVISETPILEIRDKVPDKLQILFNNEPISNAYLFVLKLQNTGNIPITPADFVDELTFHFASNTRVLDTSVLTTGPRNMKVSLVQTSGTVILKPLLLNAKDEITFKILLNTNHLPNPDGRIVGVSRIKRKKREVNDYNLFLPLLLGGTFTAVIFCIFELFQIYTLASQGESVSFQALIRGLVSTSNPEVLTLRSTTVTNLYNYFYHIREIFSTIINTLLFGYISFMLIYIVIVYFIKRRNWKKTGNHLN